MRTSALAVSSALALGLAAALPAAAEISYTYVELDYVNVDTDLSESVSDPDGDARFKSDNDGGFRLGGSWGFLERWHVFGEYSQADNDIDASGTILGVPFDLSGDFEVIRWRLGGGYAYPVSEELSIYGRASYDYIEFDDLDIGVGEDASTDDDGLGGEVGARWMVAQPFELQGYLRYTSVGDVETDEEDEFDNDLLFGVGARYYFNDMFGVQAGYEVGEINTFNLGARVQFN